MDLDVLVRAGARVPEQLRAHRHRARVPIVTSETRKYLVAREIFSIYFHVHHYGGRKNAELTTTGGIVVRLLGWVRNSFRTSKFIKP